MHDQSTLPTLHLHVRGIQHRIRSLLASSHTVTVCIAASGVTALVTRLLLRVQSSDFFSLVLEHLIKLLGASLSIFVILMNQDRPDNQLIEALEIVRALVLLRLLFVLGSSLIFIFVS